MLLFGCHGPGCLSFILGTQRYTLQQIQRIQQLQDIGFHWSISKHNHQQSMELFQQLQTFQEKYHSTKVPIVDSSRSSDGRNSGDNDSKSVKTKDIMDVPDLISPLGRWVKDQRHYYQQRTRTNSNTRVSSPMTDERIALLNEIGFEWSGKRITPYERWLNQYFKLYHHHHHHQQQNQQQTSMGSEDTADISHMPEPSSFWPSARNVSHDPSLQRVSRLGSIHPLCRSNTRRTPPVRR
jgi:hypothetical protein